MDNKHFADIPFTKETNINEYASAFNIQDNTIDFDKLDEYNDSKYVLNADGLQDIEGVVNNMQLNWEHDITNNLDNKTQLFQSWINNLVAISKEWEPGVSNKYYKNDVVTYNEDPGAYFICLEDCDGTEPINYVKFTNSSDNKNSFNWGLCVNNEIDDSNESFIGTSESGSINAFKLTYKYDGEYKLEFTKKDTFVGEINYLIFNGNREIFKHMNFIVYDSKWLRVYIRGDAGQNSFHLGWRGEWESGESYIHGAAIPPEFIPPSIVWYQVGRDINFYACIQNVTSNIPPDQDTTHWVKLFTKKLDGFVILDSMPNQAWFDDNTNPSVFGVISGSNEIFYYSNLANHRYDGSVISQLHDGVVITQVQPIRAYNNAHCIAMCRVFKNGVYVETLNTEFIMNGDGQYNSINIDENTYISLFCRYYMGTGFYSQIELIINNIYDETDSYEFEVYISHIVSHENIIKIVDRIHSESASNPQYLKLYTVANNVVDSNDNNLNTLINNLISNANI